MKRHCLELLPFCEVFNYFYNFIKHIYIPNDVKSELSKTTDIFYERHLLLSGVLSICIINNF